MLLPTDLTDKDQWVVWKYVDSRKVPVQVGTGTAASSTNPSHWSSYRDAVDYLASNQKLNGLGFVFVEDDGLVGIDIDNCIKD